MKDLNLFVQKIPDFKLKSSGELIPYFAFYLINIKNEPTIISANINRCFLYLAIQPYSNIPSYLSTKSSGKNPIFIKHPNGYILSRNAKENIAKQLNTIIELPISEKLFSLDILKNTRSYLVEIAKQMMQCYDLGLYDASFVMMRKLIETLIIESFERFGNENEIKDSNGVFIYLSDLIPKYVNNTKWNASRNLKVSMKKIKHYGDLSAHNRRFIAQECDFNDFKLELRQAVQEIVLIIDYPNWH